MNPVSKEEQEQLEREDMYAKNLLHRRWVRGEHCGLLERTKDWKNFLKFTRKSSSTSSEERY